MAEATYLRANVGIADPALFKAEAEASIFRPVPWSVSTNVVKVQTDVPSQTPSAPGNVVTFEIPKDATYLGSVHIRYVISAMAALGGAATYKRLCDFAGIFCIQQIRILYDSNLLKTIFPEEMMYHYYKELNTEKQQAFQNDLGGGLTPNQRTTAGTATQTFNYPILLSNYYAQRSACPIVALSQKLRIEVTWAPVADVIQCDDVTDIAGAYTITSAVARCMYINTTGDERRMILGSAKAQSGISYLQSDFLYQRRIVMAAGLGVATPFTSTIANIRAPVAVMSVILRPTVYVDSNTGNPDPMLIDNVQWDQAAAGGTSLPTLVGGAAKPTGGVLATWQVTSSNNRVTPVLERDWCNNTIHSRYWPSPPQADFYSWPYSNSPVTYNASYGSINYAQLNEPILNITLATVLANSGYYVDAIGLTKNFIQWQGGSVLRTFIS
jgi:hypothetical protein